MRHLKHAGQVDLPNSTDQVLKRLDTRNERWHFVQDTRIRDELRLHNAHRLNPRCIDCYDSTGVGLVLALIAPMAKRSEASGSPYTAHRIRCLFHIGLRERFGLALTFF